MNRTRGSGTRAVFEKTIIAPEKVNETGLTEDATGTVVNVVSTTPGAISYAAFSGTHGKPITEVSIDGVAPTDPNILVGKYPFWSYEHMFTNGAPAGASKDFIDFVRASDDLLKSNGFIKITGYESHGNRPLGSIVTTGIGEAAVIVASSFFTTLSVGPM